MIAWLTTGLVVACNHGSPPAPPVDAAVAPLIATATPTVEAGVVDASVDAAIAVDAGEPVDAGADAGDPGALPQTRDRPAPTSDALTARAQTLWEAIAHDDPERAMPFFFPVSAYGQVKAVTSPSGDWKHRLVSAYTRDIHAMAKTLGKNAESATFVRLDVPDKAARWVEPNEEYNKLGYYRVFGAKLVYSVGGKERTFDISSLISWRGEWYVVHLTGFK